MFDAGAFFTQHLRAIADSQWQLIGGDFEGAVPDISPYYGDSKMPSDVTWSAAFPFIASWMRAYYNVSRLFIILYFDDCIILTFRSALCVFTIFTVTAGHTMFAIYVCIS